MYAQNEQVIKDFYGRVSGKVYTLYNGDKEARTFTGKCVGKYKKNLDITTLSLLSFNFFISFN